MTVVVDGPLLPKPSSGSGAEFDPTHNESIS